MATYSTNTTLKLAGGSSVNLGTGTGSIFSTTASQYAIMTVQSDNLANAITLSGGNAFGFAASNNATPATIYVPPSTSVGYTVAGGAGLRVTYVIFENTP